MKKLLIPFFLLGLLLNACKKDDTTTALKPTENPIATLLKDANWTAAANPAGKYELGYIFSASAKGKLTQVAAQMVDPGIYAVSIWDADTKALLRQKSVEQSSPNKFSTASIDELVIEKDKKYVVSISTSIGAVLKGYNQLRKNGSSTGTIFPISSGSVVIQKSVYANSAVSVFPAIDYSTSNAFYGFADITFIPD